MKNLIFLYDIIIYTSQIISLIFIFLVFIKYNNKTLKYYFIVMLLLFIDISVEFARIYIDSIETLSVTFNILKNVLLIFEIYFSVILIYYFTETSINRQKKTVGFLFSIIPLFLAIFDIIFSQNNNFKRISFWLNLSFQFGVILFLSIIFLKNSFKITNEFKIKTRKIIVTFLILTSLLYFVDTIIYLRGFYFSYIPIIFWNILSIWYIWKNYLSHDNPPIQLDDLEIKFKLSGKEKEIILLIKKGLINKEIAYELGVSESSVKVRIHKIFKKIHVKNRVDLLNLLG